MNSNDEFDILKALGSKEKVLFTFDGKNSSKYWDFKIQGNEDATQLLEIFLSFVKFLFLFYNYLHSMFVKYLPISLLCMI